MVIDYPSITSHTHIASDNPRDPFCGITYYAYPKYDGSNFTASYRDSWYYFGTRTRELDSTSPFADALKLIPYKELEALTEQGKSYQFFFEFFGEHSFAGMHVWTEPHQLILLDVAVDGLLLIPSQFNEITKGLEFAAKPIWHGKTTKELFSQIKNGEFPGATYEGVVFKSDFWTSKHDGPKMFKLKTNAYKNMGGNE